MRGMVVDTSAWVDFFAGTPSPVLEEALARSVVILSPVVAAELVSGTRRAADRTAIEDLLRTLPLHPTPLEHWLRVGELRGRLQLRGLTVSTPDAHVAQCALELDSPLLTRERIFPQIAERTTLRLIQP